MSTRHAGSTVIYHRAMSSLDKYQVKINVFKPELKFKPSNHGVDPECLFCHNR